MLVIVYVVYPKLCVRILKPLAQTWLYMFFADATFFSHDWVNRIKDEPSRQGGLRPEA